MRYGFLMPTGGPREVADLAREVEEAGWDGAFYWDGIAIGEMDTYDPWVGVAAVARGSGGVGGCESCVLCRRFRLGRHRHRGDGHLRPLGGDGGDGDEHREGPHRGRAHAAGPPAPVEAGARAHTARHPAHAEAAR